LIDKNGYPDQSDVVEISRNRLSQLGCALAGHLRGSTKGPARVAAKAWQHDDLHGRIVAAERRLGFPHFEPAAIGVCWAFRVGNRAFQVIEC